MRLQSSMRMLKDEPVPDGYMRFRYDFFLPCRICTIESVRDLNSEGLAVNLNY